MGSTVHGLLQARILSTEELMHLNGGIREDSQEPLGLQGDPPVNPKGNHSWIFIGRTDAEAEAPVLWPPDVKNWLIGKDPNAGKDWRQEEKGAAEDGITNSIDMSLSKLREIVKDRGGLHAAVHGVTESQARLSKWITATNEGTSRSRWVWGRQKEMMHASKIKLGR